MKRLIPVLLLSLLLLGSAISQASHIHGDGLPHTDCISCQLHSDQKYLSPHTVAPLPVTTPSVPLDWRNTPSPVAPRSTPNNRGPPSFN
ncbi:MAG: hypothetical protein EP312_07920 [Gammaproteobacteria bacterium]|nr:MAG: hypothetical protein EP312_07920 [Gammaproteobacteria bacterium]